MSDSLKIAYSGIEGAFAYIAAKHIFPNEELISYLDFAEVYSAVEKGDCDYAVIPIDNSYAGEVAEVMDLLYYGDLFIDGIYSLPVVQNLLGIEGAAIEDIHTVISHPKALEQCDEFIKAHGFKLDQASNTARAAREVSEAKDIHTAAIASVETAELYGLKVLAPHINESDDNTTRFLVLSKKEGIVPNTDESESFIMLLNTDHVSGALVEALLVIRDYGFNMKVVHSRPIKGQIWHYYFYLEIEGNYLTPEGQKMVRDLAKHCINLKVLGPARPL